jgi:ABC-2 type transport system ATP-binding protein
VPAALAAWALELNDGGTELRMSYHAGEEQSCIPGLLRRIGELGIEFRDLQTRQSSLEDIFVDLVREEA